MSTLIIFAFLLITFLFLQSSIFRRITGESLVAHDIKKELDNDEYHLITDIAMPALAGKNQIEHIVVSRFGLFVIDTKYMQGWIFGGKKRKEWTQKLPSRQFSFPNPLHQNNNNIRALAYLLYQPDDKFHSMIIFSGKSTFKSKMPNNVMDKNYIDFIKSKDTAVFSKPEVELLIKKIERLKIDRPISAKDKEMSYLRHPYRT